MHNCFQVEENVISVHIKSHALPRVSRKLQKVINVKKKQTDVFSVSSDLGLQYVKVQKKICIMWL